MLNKQPISDLVTRIRRGDDTAIDELITSYRGLVIRAIRRALEPGNSLRPLITTNDIMHGVNCRLIRMCKKAQDCEEPQQLKEAIHNGFQFLVKIATHLVIDRARKYSSVTFVQFETVDDVRNSLDAVLADPAAGPATEVENQDLMQWFLSQFTTDDQPLAMKWLEGRSSELSKTSQQRIRRQVIEVRKLAKESFS